MRIFSRYLQLSSMRNETYQPYHFKAIDIIIDRTLYENPEKAKEIEFLNGLK